jgi:hypothetical protein
VASLRKFPKLAPEPKKTWLTADRTLLGIVMAVTSFGAIQMNAMNIASNDKLPDGSLAMVASARPTADYTPVGTIEKGKDGKTLSAPFGLRGR